ncbi:MAG: 3',5'-cyclic-AMP phosphodiesterase [Pseudomonadales bacterium]|nr:3',5'-cyclic-AMP phosphodiesterase [Pseudomonadales bacterium]
MARDTSQPPIRIVQLSDCHLFRTTEGKLLGLNTEHSLSQVMDLIQLEQPDAELVLATGDLSQDGSDESYARFHRWMEAFSCPVYWLPGNHDLTDIMQNHQAAQRMSPCVIDLGPWQVIMLDSTIRGKVPGRFAPAELQFLEQALQAATDCHVLIALHHQPVPVGSRWLDQQIVGNAADFFQVVDRFDNVQAIIWGHVHQVFETRRNGVQLMSVPSTCVQFMPQSQDFAVDKANPGYRWLDLFPDGSLDTGVSRVTGVEFVVDYSVKGY